jgi:hypothetical protein
MPSWPTTESNATHPFGTGLFWAPLGTVPTAPAIGTPLTAPWTEIGLMTRVTAPERAAGDTKITHLKSPNKAHEYVPGFVEGGSLTCRLHHSPASRLAIDGLAPDDTIAEQRVQFAIQFADGVVVYFGGYVKSYPVEVADGDDPIAIDVTIKVSGDIFIA